MKTVLIAINSKYIHTSPAVDSIAAFAAAEGVATGSLSFTVNQPGSEILGRIYAEKADVYCFSVYIWNVETVLRIAEDLKKVQPDAVIWLGGPEVSYRAEEILAGHKEISGIMRGEGEETFAELISFLNDHGNLQMAPAESSAYVNTGELSEKNKNRDEASEQISRVQGITYRDENGNICQTQDRPALDMNRLVFPYFKAEPDLNRIYYYESSRGCPFSCSYCLSSIDRKLRFKDIGKTEQELLWFLEAKVKQVKFVDRTFNVDHKRSMEIWRFLKDHDNGITNFHFEICGELLTQEELDFLKTLRPGQVQFEIGVQTANPNTLEQINRKRDEKKLRANVAALLAGKNIHIHLDLIAGLPGEDLESFRHSFNTVYGMRPLQLQLGFLKILSGTPMEAYAKEHGFVYSSRPPYEVLETPDISYDDLLELIAVEEMVEVYYNSHQFEKTMARLESFYAGGDANGDSPADYYELYLDISRVYRKKGYDRMDHARMRRYEILLEFIDDRGWDREEFIPCLLYDALARERFKHWPVWAGDHKKPKGFNYDVKDPLTGNAAYFGPEI